MEFENALKTVIKEKYGSVRAFSQSIGMPYSTIDNIFKRGIMGVSVQVVLKICDALNIDVEKIRDNTLVFKENIREINLLSDEKQLISDYRELSAQGQEYIRQTMFMAKQTYKKSADNSTMENTG